MDYSQKVEDLKITLSIHLKDTQSEVNKLREEVQQSLDISESHGNLQALICKLSWKTRDIILFNSMLSELIQCENILNLKDQTDEYIYTRFHEHIERIRSYVMNENTLNFSTSPESNLKSRAEFMSYRKVFMMFNNKLS